MAITDFLTLYFFWVVKDEGSWLEIGSTISHFFIASLLCIFVAALEGVSEKFIAGVEVENDDIARLEKESEIGGVVTKSNGLANGHGKKTA
jgi:phosphatidylinositol glycan class N